MSRLSVPIVSSTQTGPARPDGERKAWEVHPCELTLACGKTLDVRARTLDQGPQDDNAKRSPVLSWPCPDACRPRCTYQGRSDRAMGVDRDVSLMDGWIYGEVDVMPGPSLVMVSLPKIVLGTIIAFAAGFCLYFLLAS